MILEEQHALQWHRQRWPIWQAYLLARTQSRSRARTEFRWLRELVVSLLRGAVSVRAGVNHCSIPLTGVFVGSSLSDDERYICRSYEPLAIDVCVATTFFVREFPKLLFVRNQIFRKRPPH